MDKDATDVLVAVRELLSDPHNWTKYASGRDRSGIISHPSHPNTKSRCITGAVYYIADKQNKDVNVKLAVTQHIRKFTPHGHIIHFNDHPLRGHPSVLKLLDKAIKHANE